MKYIKYFETLEEYESWMNIEEMPKKYTEVKKRFVLTV